MQTSTAYQPYPLNTPPPPPRNTGIPDTSIAGGVPQVNDTRPPTEGNRFDFGNTRPLQEESSLSLPELEAQKSQPAPAAQPAAKPRRFTFKATKAAMKLTSIAVEQLREMQDQPDAKLIKVGVKNRGCSGLAYHLEYVEKPGPFDEVVEQDGVKVLIDSKALFSIVGSEMDWVEDKLNQRFTFTNPNISMLCPDLFKTFANIIVEEQCGCGESFMV
jgi:iron-sulfur cluster assembly accessory protein